MTGQAHRFDQKQQLSNLPWIENAWNGREENWSGVFVWKSPQKKWGESEASSPSRTAEVLVAQNSWNCGARCCDGGTCGVKPNHAGLVRAKGALTSHADRACGWMAFGFEAVSYAVYYEHRSRGKLVAALRAAAQNRVD